MPKFLHTPVVEVPISPAELAELFWSMDNAEQVAFFNHLGVLCDDSYKRQLQFLAVMEESTGEAREVMRDLGWAANEIYFDE